MKILVTPTSLQPGKNDHMLQYLQKFSTDLVFNPYGRPLAGKELKELLHDCDGYIAGVDKIDAEALSDCPKLKVISRYGVGVDGVDFAVANEKHIKVTNTPGANSEAVGELAFAMILALARNLSYLDTKDAGRRVDSVYGRGAFRKDTCNSGTWGNRKDCSALCEGI